MFTKPSLYLMLLLSLVLGACGGGSGGAPGGGTGGAPGGGTGGAPGGGTGGTPTTDWVTRSVGLSSKITAAAWSGTKYVAISDAGDVFSSTDGASWNTKSSGAGRNDVVWGNGLFVSASASGYIHTSPDGITWTPRNICSCVDSFFAVAWSGSQFTAVGAGGRIYASADGINWTQQMSGATAQDTFGDVVATATVRVAVGFNSTTYLPVVRYSIDGTTWNTPTFDVAPASSFVNAIWDGSRFVISGSGSVYTSADGAAWTYVAGFLYTDGMAWDGSKYFTGSLSGVTTSTDLVNWTDAFRYGSHAATDVVHAGGQYLLVGYNTWTMDAGWLATSTDGANWTVRVGSDPKHEVIWDGSKFMALDSGGRVFTSIDGLSDWSSPAGIGMDYGSEVFRGLAYSPTLNRYVAASGNKIASSDDGVTWTSRHFATLLEARSVIWTGSKFILAGWNSHYLVSADGITWTYKSISGTITPMVHMEDVAWSSNLGLYVAVTANPASSIFTSADETTWNELGAAAPKGLYGIVWTGSRFVAVGASGTIVTSVDGANWINRSVASGPTFYDVQAISGKVVAVGASGKVFVSSDDGVNWVEQTTDTTNTLFAVAASPTRAVAVGNVGTVISQ